MVEQVLNREQDIEAMKSWSQRRAAGPKLWKQQDDSAPEEVSISAAGSLKVKNPGKMKSPEGSQGYGCTQHGYEERKQREHQQCVGAGVAAQSVFPGNGNFGMRLSLDVLTDGEDIPQNVVVSEVDAGGLACQLGLQKRRSPH